LIVYSNLTLPEEEEINKLRTLRNVQREKLVFRKEFKNHSQNSNIDNEIIDAYFGKNLTAEKASAAYNYHNQDERIEVNEIDDQGKVEINGKVYDLKTSEGLGGVRQAKKEENYIESFLTFPNDNLIAGANHDRIEDEYINLFDEPEIEGTKRQVILI